MAQTTPSTAPPVDPSKPPGASLGTTVDKVSNAVDQMADISVQIRKAILAALPGPPEQNLTVMVPGKVVNFDDYEVSNDKWELPPRVELKQAILCDDMPVIASVQMGPTGRSVSRSYVSSISKLVSNCSFIGLEKSKMTEEQKYYERGMIFLSSPVGKKDNKTVVELYTELQEAYTKAVSDKAHAFHEARERVDEAHGKDVEAADVAFKSWLDENARAWRNRVQAAYMNWVVTGRKEEVEFWFAVVDKDTAMSRIELSKEILRSAVVQDEDGSCEYPKVKLEPPHWANLCKEKMNQLVTPKGRTLEWYNSEIARLKEHKFLLAALKDNPPKFTLADSKKLKEDFDAKEVALKNAMDRYLKAKNDCDTLPAKSDGSAVTPKVAGSTVPVLDPKKVKVLELSAATTALAEAKKQYRAAQEKAKTEQLRSTTNNLTDSTLSEKGYIAKQIEDTDATIKSYETIVSKWDTSFSTSSSLVESLAIQTKENAALPDPERKTDAVENSLADFFTSIHLSVSQTSEKSQTESSATAYGGSVGGSGGFWSASVSAEHSDAQAEAMRDLSSCDVDVSFDVMRVDISRSWLFGELFSDPDLRPGPNVKISPGPLRLKSLIEGTVGNGMSPQQIRAELESYSFFPMYPTAFYVAANVVLDVKGNTSSLHTYMNTRNDSGSAEVGFGPFSASASFNKSSSKSMSSTETTSTGCRIAIRSPQIIGWVSTILPALPRP